MVIPKKRSGRPSMRPDPQYLADLYETFTAKEIGDMFNVPASTVRSWVCRLRKSKTCDEERGLDE